MLRHLGETAAAEDVETAVREVIAEHVTVPRDLGGEAGTQEFAAVVEERLARLAADHK